MPPQTVLVFPNPADSHLALVTNPDGSHVTFLGTKDPTGLPVSVTSFVQQSPDDDPTKTVNFTLDSAGRPSIGTLYDGSQVTIGYISTTDIELTIVDSASVTHHFSYDPITGKVIPSTSISRALKTTGSLSRSVAAGSVTNGNVQVACLDKSPISDAVVTGTYFPKTFPLGVPEFDMPLTTIPDGKGNYAYAVPASPFTTSDPTLAEQIGAILDKYIEPICNIMGPPDPSNLELGLALTPDRIALITTQISAYSVIASRAIPYIGAAITAACLAKKVFDSINTIYKAIELFDGGGTLSFQASHPPAEVQSAAPMFFGWPSTTPPSFNIWFSCLKLHVQPSDVTVQMGGDAQLTITATDLKGTSVPPPPVEWSPASPAVATVNSSGVVFGVAPGTATVTAKDPVSGSSTSAAVQVIAPDPLIFQNNNAVADAKVYFDFDGTLFTETDYIPAGQSQDIKIPDTSAATHTLVVTGLSSTSDTGLIGYTLTLPSFLEFVSVTSDRGGGPVPLSGSTTSDLLVLAPISGPFHRTNTYTVKTVTR
jgi:hypothetical protein